MTETAKRKSTLSKSDRIKAWQHSTSLQGSWDYERMQNGGWAYSLVPALRKLYLEKKNLSLTLRRRSEFFSTHPYLASPITGVALALEEGEANGADVDNTAVQGVKVGMMGPLASIGDPVFWCTVRPVIRSLGAPLALSGDILGLILFFVLWNIIHIAFLRYTQEMGYKANTKITEDASGGLLQKITHDAPMMGVFIIGALIKRWVTINFKPVTSSVPLQKGAYISWNALPKRVEGVHKVLSEYDLGNGMALDKIKGTALRQSLDSLIPGLAALLLTLLCMWLLKKRVSPIVIIIGIFVVDILDHVIDLL